MKTSISIGSAYYNGEDWDDLVEYTVEAERAGVDSAWSAEAWGMDAIVPLAYIAARTEKIKLGTGIMQISSRVPSMIAMTAQSLDTVSHGRFLLGLGVSGPQVVEGLHGANFAQPDQLLIVDYPLIKEISSHFSKNKQVTVINPISQLRKADWSEGEQYYTNDPHLNQNGQITVGKLVLNKLNLTP